MKKIITLAVIFLSAFSINIYSQCGMTIITSTSNATCDGFCDGIVITNVTGGTPPYTYSWDTAPVQTTATASGLCAGVYIVSVTDATNCTQIQTVVVTQPALLTASITSTTNASCNSNCDGAATATFSGGTSPYTYYWLPSGQTTTSVIGLCVGTYSFIVSDVNGCTAQAEVIITGPPAFTFSLTPTNPSTCSACDGALSVSAITGGAPPYSYMWSNGASTTAIIGLCSGNYWLTVTDATGCAVSSSYLLTAVNNLTVTGTIINAGCADGSIDITVSNGVPPYTYLWNVGATTEDVSNLPPGNYSVTVWDANSCPVYAFFTVTQEPPGPACSQINGKVYNDANNDCVFNGTDMGLSGRIITAVPGPYYSVTNSLGDYSMILPPGTYSVTQTLPATWGELCPGSGYPSVVANAASITPNIDFADTILPMQDLSIWCFTSGAAPGFPRMYYFYYANPGTIPMNGTVYLVIDPLDNFSYSSTTPSSVSGDTIFWNFTNLQPFQYNYITVNCSNLPANPALLGDTIFYCAKIIPIAGDINPANNTSCGFIEITGSYDPNAKEVSPKGTGPNGNILPTDTILTYTIHFQNTGTAYAQFVVLRDTLSSYLNPATVESGPSSHSYVFSMSGNGILKWTFDNIWLPDSATDLAGSNGYVTFRIHLKPNLPLGTVITNEADIYFDYNPPITTNAVINTIAIQNSVWSLNGGMQNFLLYPNPTSGIFTIQSSDKISSIEIVNVLGEKIAAVTAGSGSKIQIDISSQPRGIYFLQVKTAEGTAVRKIVIQR